MKGIKDLEELDNVLEEANKCLNCKNAMCRIGCPISSNIPDFIKSIKEKDLKKAYEILQENNIMSHICSIVCPVEKQCVGNCIKGIKGDAIKINELEKFVNDWAISNNIKYDQEIKKITNKKVAIIGSGPAGIACAVELKKAGTDVTIYEKEKKCGGILEYGIPNFRLPKNIVQILMEKIKRLGIKVETETEFGKDLSIKDLKEKGFNNIFLAVGNQVQNNYPLTNDKIVNIYNSDEFLKKYNSNEKIENLGIVVVIGGGNVAFDSARVAKRLDAKEVYILYRRTKELMPGCKSELNDTLEDGVKIIFQTKVIRAKTNNNKLTKIECIKTEIVDNKAIDLEGSNYFMDANTIIFAIGSKIDEDLFNKLNIKTKNGLVCINEKYMTSITGIYAGGDLVEEKSSVCRAISTGKKVAQEIIKNERNVI